MLGIWDFWTNVDGRTIEDTRNVNTENYKTWQLRMHCNLRPPEPRQPLPALITTRRQVRSHWSYPLPCYSVFSVFVVDTFLYAVTLTSHLWSLTLNICSGSPVTWWNSVPNLNAIEQSTMELLRFQCLTLWPWTLCYVLRSALG